jgi:hypothetical protein
MAVTLQEFREKYGLSTVKEYSFSVTDKPVLILKNNPKRFEFVVVNLGSQPCTIAFTPNVSLNFGVNVPANGGIVSMRVEEDGAATCWEIYAISNATGTTLYVQEYEAMK